MPEGPEIRRAADKIAKVLEAKKIERVEFAFEHLKPFEYELQSREIVSLETRGKALLTHFDNGLSIYS
ncbi:MAG: endonuclease VIII, partial [Porticoccaceae bacterium]|nr:endonuclease VIII [Porticoccaceae bacterium]